MEREVKKAATQPYGIASLRMQGSKWLYMKLTLRKPVISPLRKKKMFEGAKRMYGG